MISRGSCNRASTAGRSPHFGSDKNNHISVGCFATRVSTYLGDGSVPGDADLFDARHEPATLPSTAAGAVDCLGHMYRNLADSDGFGSPEWRHAPE